MPIVKISIRKGRTETEKKELLDAVHLSLVEAFKVPESDRIQRIFEFNDSEFEIPSDKSERFTLIEIAIFPGRSDEAKKKLYKLIFDRLKKLGYQDNDALVILSEPDLNNWGIRGIAASEIDLGFNLNV